MRKELQKPVDERRQEWWKILEVIEQQVVKLVPPDRLRARHQESIAELQAIHALAVEEKAEKTTKHLEELIARRNKDFEDNMEKLRSERIGLRR
ncbi:MAG: hypothetical protein ACYS74_00860 [Planctomycetota bacterium]